MESISISYLAILVGAILSMVIGAVWYGPLFGKKWMEIIGVSTEDPEANKKMQKAYMPMYVLAHLMADTTKVGGTERALLVRL